MPLTSPTITPVIVGPNATGKVVDLTVGLIAASGGGDAFKCQGKEVIFINNGDVGTHTATFKSVASNFGIVLAGNDVSLAVPTLKMGIIGPFNPLLFADSNGLVQITWDAVTSVTIGAKTFSVAS